MTEEIKEILARLNKIVPYAEVPKELLYMTTSITPQDCKLLLDYITNLKDENERLKQNQSGFTLENYGRVLNDIQELQDEKERLKEELENVSLDEANIRADILLEQEDYKSRINKAIDKLYCWGEVLNPDFQKEMLNILNGGDKK